MNYKILGFLCSTIILFGCEQTLKNSKKLDISLEKKYKNSGFALVYDEKFPKIKKLDKRSLNIYHKSLKKKINSKN